jgi:citrate synthase
MEIDSIRESIKEIEGITGRTFYMWHGILTIARLVNKKELFENLVKLAIENKEEMEAEIALYNEQPEEIVRALIKMCENSPQQDYFSNDEIMNALVALKYLLVMTWQTN